MSQKNITIGIVSDSKVLLLKRGETAPWQPHKYCFVGGGVDSGETLVNAAIRETNEETNISLCENNLQPITTYRNNKPSLFFTYYFKDRPCVKLNYEHSEYVWLSYEECIDYYKRKLLVPYLIVKLNSLHSLGII